MKRLLVCLLLFLSVKSEAQVFSRHLVTFKNKANSPFSLSNPSAFLSQRAIERRTRYNLAVDSTDLPVNPAYLDSLRLAGDVRILNVSRWLNKVSIQTTDEAALARINSFAFVEKANPIAARRATGRNGQQSTSKEITTVNPQVMKPTVDFFNYGLSFPQVHIHNGEFLHNIGLRGQDMIIGMLDGGFLRYNVLPAFDSVNLNGQVLDTYDFVSGKTGVADNSSHGMQCFSVIAANMPSQFVGTAPKAKFFLFITEDAASEYQIEEHNWVCGAERTDSAGGDLISSSLGYSNDMSDPRFNHTYADMNGNTTIAARGADLAAKKGILVLNAAGNQGNEAFRFIATPADGDSVLAVGAVNTSGQVAAFSSYGPTPDGRIKPDVASVGVATVVQTTGGIGTNNGTSFANPNMAGLAACLWQGFREFSNMKIIQSLRESGNRSSAPDNRVGYGIPDMKKAVLLLLNDFSTATVTAGSCRNTISWVSKDIRGMKYELERKAPGESMFIKIGEQLATATVFSTQSHSITDSLINIQAGTISYRIRQIIDTAFSTTVSAGYIDTVTVTLPATCTTTPVTNVPFTVVDVTVLPNPAKTTVSLRISSPGAINNLTIRIIDNGGRTVATQKGKKAAGTTDFSFPVSSLAAGQYFLVVYDNNVRLATREFIRL